MPTNAFKQSRFLAAQAQLHFERSQVDTNLDSQLISLILVDPKKAKVRMGTMTSGWDSDVKPRSLFNSGPVVDPILHRS